MKKVGAVLLSFAMAYFALASPERIGHQTYAKNSIQSPQVVKRVSTLKLSLQEAIDKALEQNYELKAKVREMKVKKYDYKAAKGNLLPKITFTVMSISTNNPGWGAFYDVLHKNTSMTDFGKYMDLRDAKMVLHLPNMGLGTWIEDLPFGNFLDDVIPDFQKGVELIDDKPTYPWAYDFSTKIQIEQPLYAGGKILTGIKMAKKDYKASLKDVARQKEKVIYDVSKAYYGAMLAKGAIRLAHQAYKSAEKHYKTALQMYENGLVVFADVLRAKVFLLDVKSKITEAENNYLIAKRGLLLAMGVDNMSPNDIDVSGNLVCDTVNQDVQYFQDYAMQNRADLLSMRIRVTIAKDMIKFTKGDFKPTLGMFYNYETHDNKFGRVRGETGYHNIGFMFNWTLFKGFQTVNKYKGAKEKFKQYSTGQKGYEEFIKFSVYKAYEEMKIQKDKVKTAEQNVKYAEEVLKITENSYQNQLVSMIDLIDTQTMYDKVKFDLLHANYNCQLAVLELKYQSGMLLEGIR